ncbi:uncharacterized protein LOC142917422 [Petromyzon marinus]|uniref:uncharacterized protein LOC142917422 n=1 Tax=Petromyzon marinus TaxID=7757 RepID=UPI003F6EB6FA
MHSKPNGAGRVRRAESWEGPPPLPESSWPAWKSRPTDLPPPPPHRDGVARSRPALLLPQRRASGPRAGPVARCPPVPPPRLFRTPAPELFSAVQRGELRDDSQPSLVDIVLLQHHQHHQQQQVLLQQQVHHHHQQVYHLHQQQQPQQQQQQVHYHHHQQQVHHLHHHQQQQQQQRVLQAGSSCVVLKGSQIPAGLCRTLTGPSVNSSTSSTSTIVCSTTSTAVCSTTSTAVCSSTSTAVCSSTSTAVCSTTSTAVCSSTSTAVCSSTSTAICSTTSTAVCSTSSTAVCSTSSRSSRWCSSASPRTAAAAALARKSKANARERLRVRYLNRAFLLLRRLLPLDRLRPSRVATLRATVRYVGLLQAVLAETAAACGSSPRGA